MRYYAVLLAGFLIRTVGRNKASPSVAQERRFRLVMQYAGNACFRSRSNRLIPAYMTNPTYNSLDIYDYLLN
ncbi:hypothetical protein Mettu_2071 [Methylobacter tundripaludum SV96]|uniref:Uncharacterized protein n=1 Tax=Methylobacter tundripaludum (strain ATCC BAA-1195 / DSM 17260 / SV96) TaxID=697282 RepID=G3IQM5_METTV|nr:hypothetical protein Mettu_2071 [Methylobacter tundripaludum SV96]